MTKPSAERAPIGAARLTDRGSEGELTSSLLYRHHEQAETACLDLLGQAFADDPRALVAAWRELESKIIAHFAAEEAALLPRFERADREAATRIREQHAALLELVNRVGLEVQLHVLRASTVRAFVQALRAHTIYEGLTLYRWAEAALTAAEREAVWARLAS